MRFFDSKRLPLSSTPSEVRNAYRTLAVRVHPDKVATHHVGHATAEFQKLKAAYNVCLPHADSLAVFKSRNATCEDEPDADLSDTHSGNVSQDNAFFTEVLREPHEDEILIFNASTSAAVLKREKLYGDMAEEEERILSHHEWRGRGADPQAWWTAEQKLAHHRKAYAANGKLDRDIKKICTEGEGKAEEA
ncbi:hypothetical protein PMIN03_008606 [Paraphaeosphaeria minitans]|uniref:J domain-containing protein n=1 Tax=Paraphaeosphaeria minitans TaxID=565426 RepID=A0A9P6GSQ4_9PLEO|nr:hypothetical protein PMIN01_00721 [Paraphaeosphaeria minitans]